MVKNRFLSLTKQRKQKSKPKKGKNRMESEHRKREVENGSIDFNELSLSFIEHPLQIQEIEPSEEFFRGGDIELSHCSIFE